MRASALTLDVASLTLDRGSLLDTPPRPPNLRTALPVAFTIRFTQEQRRLIFVPKPKDLPIPHRNAQLQLQPSRPVPRRSA